MMTYVLILIISLKSQFNHSLDVKYLDTIVTEKACIAIAEKTIADLKYFNADVEVKYSCVHKV